MAWSRVEVEVAMVRAIAYTIYHAQVGEFKTDYDSRQARSQAKGKDPNIVPLDGAIFDNEETLFVLRRLPLAQGYKTTLPILSPVGVSMKIGLAVPIVEDLQVAAGKIRCYKVELSPINQTF